MKRIDWNLGFTDELGTHRSGKEIEDWFVDGKETKVSGCNIDVLKKIRNKIKSEKKHLGNIHSKRTGKTVTEAINQETEKRTKNLTNESIEVLIKILKILDNEKLLRDILTAKPKRLNRYTRIYKLGLSYQNYGISVEEEIKKQRDKIEKELLFVFGYENFRNDKLVELSRMINIKCCPYCNQHYTLTTDDLKLIGGKKKYIKRAFLQFDHFLPKTEYPILSMSIYNLIPSCQICNHRKSEKEMTLNFHPYESDIDSKFKFRVQDPLKLKIGTRADVLEVELQASEAGIDSEIKDYDREFNISKRYGRHLDIVEEIYARVYTRPYYSLSEHFDGILKTGDKELGKFIKREFGNESVRERIEFGNYRDPRNINRRPMVKFMADIYGQFEEMEKLGRS